MYRSWKDGNKRGEVYYRTTWMYVRMYACMHACVCVRLRSVFVCVCVCVCRRGGLLSKKDSKFICRTLYNEIFSSSEFWIWSLWWFSIPDIAYPAPGRASERSSTRPISTTNATPGICALARLPLQVKGSVFRSEKRCTWDSASQKEYASELSDFSRDTTKFQFHYMCHLSQEIFTECCRTCPKSKQ